MSLDANQEEPSQMSGPKNALADKQAAPAMPPSRLELPGGEWAEFQTRPNRREYRAVFKAVADSLDAPNGDRIAVQEEVVSLLLVKLDVKDRDGGQVETTVEGLALCPAETLTLLFDRASDIFKAIPRPNLSSAG